MPTSEHAWCERCRRVFISDPAKNAHLRESRRHNFCSACPQSRDFKTPEELEDHSVDAHHFCPDCNMYHNSAGELRDHDVVKHYLCVRCDGYFGNDNNLRMHQQKHQTRSMECYGCYQTFKSLSGMLIHLESGNCPSRATEEEIDNIARKCYQSRKYIISEDGGWLYRCPSCSKEFLKLSALYQHAEDTPRCSFLSKGHECLAKLEHFIARSIHRQPSELVWVKTPRNSNGFTSH
ncbi:hypothetical protein P175DRAFT_0554817 [Aspergillus ochraceoroseus IBT 24754]|uniref:C2H2-type domain-containing protein n=1 Tax=Aspergillus ochraceoroseus IBT 24754 TaxID=1392256 RepID=A0A2T5MAM6_9EURO|nr:uncharacterized protein P175DRAFT_0554817 [Aspergillus ochraceoroseus IBT 24754]PTU25586.1 hypothetical protein P175DRAFT_0554817 [Aspergillus ochraceoroseus IBT 24754]